MKSETIQEPQTNDLILQINQSGLEPETGQSLKEQFLPFYEQAQEWKQKAESLVVTSSDQLREMKEARIARLALKDIRVEVEKKRKALKEDSLRKGKAIDGIANVLKYLIEPIEEHLEAQENFAAVQEAKRLDAQKEERLALLKPFEVSVEFYDIRHMPQAAFDELLNNAKRNHEEKIEAARKAEADRIAKEKADAEERERVRLENAKLKAEAEAREKQIAAEREKAAKEKAKADESARVEREKQAALLKAEQDKAAKLKAESDAKLKAEAEARKKIEDELKAKKAAEEKAKKDAELAEKKAAAAPDKQKLVALAKTIKAIELPSVKSEEAIRIVKNTQDLIIKLCKFIEDKTEEL